MLLESKIEANNKRRQISALKDDINRLKQNMDIRNKVTVEEIDSIKALLTDLTNKKANLELKIKQSQFHYLHYLALFYFILCQESCWQCSKCTFQNLDQNIKCRICSNERDGTSSH